MTLDRWRVDPCAFIEECLVSPYDGNFYQLNAAERAFVKQAFQLTPTGRLKYPLLVYSAIKKSRKTELAGMLTLTMMLLFGGRYAEAFIVANDMEQAVARCFTGCVRIVEATPLLKHEAKVTANKIFFPSLQSTVTAIAADYAGISGAHPTISTHDELWAATSERSRRLFDELVPVPTRPISCRLVTSTAGFEDEGHLLFELYNRAMALPEVDTDLRAGDGMLCHWSHRPLCHWQTPEWLAEMRRELRPNQYLRMIENRFTTTEQSFIPMESWDGCVLPHMLPLREDFSTRVWVGLDASYNRDSTAIVTVTYDRATESVRLVRHSIFQPSLETPIDFEAIIEANLLDLKRRFWIDKVLYDPHQMLATAQRLERAGLPMEKFDQTPANLTAMAENLCDLLRTKHIMLYPDAQMRRSASQAVAVETERGWRIAKRKQTHKIDVIIALAMATYGVVNAAHGNAPLPYAAANGADPYGDDYARQWRVARYHYYVSSGGMIPPF